MILGDLNIGVGITFLLSKLGENSAREHPEGDPSADDHRDQPLEE